MTNSIPTSILEKFTTFGDLLRYLRRRTGLTQIEMSIAVGYSDAQISRLEQNLRLPDPATIAARFVPVLDLDDEPIVVAQLLQLATHMQREDAPASGLCPYKGLNYFDETDADLFVGREALTNKLVERFLSHASSGSLHEERFLAVVGASGSGKSSLVRAGLVPALHWNQASADWSIHIFTPGAHPLESLAECLLQQNKSAEASATLIGDLVRDTHSLHLFNKRSTQFENTARVLLVIDQFEELFALCRSETERTLFIDNLLTSASELDGPTGVIITLRADFYAHCAAYVQLREALAHHQEYIGPMSEEELRRAIEEPAGHGHWEFEPGLVDLLLHDAGAGHEPGALPLLSHALLETWQRRRGRTLTLSGYTSSGGVRGAIAETAESVYTDQLTNAQQAIARRIFLRLTELGDEMLTGDTRRRATFNELILKPEEAATTQAVLKSLADARLITTNEDSVEVAHEALIREWPTLRGWLEDNREGLRLQRQFTDAAQEWEMREREPDMLYRGARLAQLREWAQSHADEMNILEHAFLNASVESSEREALEREAQRQRELEAAQKLAETERRSLIRLRSRNRVITTIGSIAIILALVAGMFGIQSKQNALASQNNAATAQVAKENAFQAQGTAQAASTQAIADFTRSEAQRLASEANSLLLSHGDSNLTALLAVRSLKMQYTSSGGALLGSLTSLSAPPWEFKGHTADLWSVAFSLDGKYLATGSSDGTARLWDLATGETVHIFEGHSGEVFEVKFSPDGKTLLVGSAQAAHLWDVASRQLLQVFTEIKSGGSVAFSPDGKYIVTASFDDKNARLWDVATGRSLHTLVCNGPVIRVAYSTDGKYILTGTTNSTAQLWDPTTGKQVRDFVISSGIEALTFSPDSTSITFGTSKGTAQIWSISTGEFVREFSGHEGLVLGIKFSADGRFLLTGSGDRTARLWDIATGQTIYVFGGHGNTVQDVAFSLDGKLIATAGNDGIARVWKLETFPGGTKFNVAAGAVQASFSPDSKQIVVAVQDGTARIFDRTTGQIIMSLNGPADTEIRGAVFSPDGRQVLTASSDGVARLWDLATGKELRRFDGHTDLVNKAIFSPDGKYIVTASYDGTARVWDVQTGQTMVTYTNQGPGHVNRVAFSPDGKTVATSGDNGTVHTWDPFTGKDIMNFEGHTDDVRGIAFSPDGKYLVTASIDGSVRLWEATTGKEVRRFAGHPGGATGATFSPDGKYVASGGVDGIAGLWDVQSGQEIRRFVGGRIEIVTVTFSSDGKYILTASFDGNVRLWLVDVDETIRAICGLLTRDLTPEERVQFGILDEEPTCPVH
jgi:WD40 repeat protein